MKILYYYWGENTAYDCLNSMKELGHTVDVFNEKMVNYTKDDEFSLRINEVIKKYDCVFSFNYFPVIADVANNANIIYISWVYDSPNLTLEAKNLSSPFNKVYIFDYELCNYYKGLGVDTVEYMPLPYSRSRIEKLTNYPVNDYMHEISFIGNLYDDKYNFIDSVTNIPEYLKGYIDALVETQKKIYGFDLISKAFDDDKCLELSKYVEAKLSDAYRDCEYNIFRDMIRRKVTSVERPEVLRTLGKVFPVALYSGREPINIPVKYMGVAENREQMPRVFHESKINLNITLRSIRSGIPLRVVEILGAGGFCITNYQPEMQLYFENGKNIVWYEDLDDLVEKCKFYLSTDNEVLRKRIANEGNIVASKIFDYDILLPQMLKLN